MMRIRFLKLGTSKVEQLSRKRYGILVQVGPCVGTATEYIAGAMLITGLTKDLIRLVNIAHT